MIAKIAGMAKTCSQHLGRFESEQNVKVSSDSKSANMLSSSALDYCDSQKRLQ